ncbi:hypothetical protein BDV59DRAFT_202663 [Aspergillus ambiguus]|uniref:flavin monoamine oxidase family protein n=1 Tax=Aspergillus ambiguus TaxID=176160 RepID=UPI003CCD6D61
MARSKEGFLWTPKQCHEGLDTDAVQGSSSTIRPAYDVIVIGAGFAGLIAARELSRTHGQTVLLVEARDRIGGRTWTARVLGEEIEMGGTWVHWDQPHVYSQLQRYGLHRHLKTSAGTLAPTMQLFRPAGGPVEEVSIEETAAVLERVAQRFFTVDGLESRALMPYPHDPLREPAPWRRYDGMSVQDRLDQLGDVSGREKALLESTVSTFGSAPGREIGFVEALRWYALGGHRMAGVFEKAGVYKLGKGGMTAFARAILHEYRGDMLFQTTVREIKQEGETVLVTCASGQVVRARAVVSTIPLNCLGDVRFQPPLCSVRQAAIARGQMNTGAKIHVKLQQTRPGWFYTADGNGDARFVFAFSDHNGTQGSGPTGTWCIGFGYNGQLTEKRDSREIVGRFRQEILPTAEVEAYATHDWAKDEYAKGVWACWGAASASHYLDRLQQPHKRVIFASADWADGWRGFVDGAIERGQEAVRAVMQLDGKAKL